VLQKSASSRFGGSMEGLWRATIALMFAPSSLR
jgi:hypothetical protein